MSENPAIRPIRSALFVPGSRERAIEKAAGLGADMLILDLEDAVAPSEKDAARARISQAMAAWADRGALRAIRINSIASDEAAADLKASADADIVVLPKVGNLEPLKTARRFLPDRTKLWAMIETPLGVLNLESIARADRNIGLTGLIAGTNDLAKDLHASGRKQLDWHLAKIVTAARAFSLTALDGVYNAFTDADGFQTEAAAGKAMGFHGKSLIHPSQVEPCNAAFGPSAAEIDYARRLVAEFSKTEHTGVGAIAFDGAMVERLHLTRAEALLNQIGESE